MDHLGKYVKYLENLKGVARISEFDEDWEPIGPSVRSQLIEAGIAEEIDGKLIALTDNSPA